MEPVYIGIVVEEALDDNTLINNLTIEKVHITDHENRQDRWHMYKVKVSLDQINELAGHVIDDWYIHFWNGSNHLTEIYLRALIIKSSRRNNSPNAAPPNIITAPTICIKDKVSPKNTAEKNSAESGSR